MDYPDLLGDSYGTTLRDSLDAACQLLDLNLYVVAGHGLEDPDPSSFAYNKVFHWIHPGAVDGIIVLSTSLAAHRGSEAVQRLCNSYEGMPLCGIGITVQGIPSIVIDNRLAMRAVVEHLVNDHGCKRPLFIGGPPMNAEAQIRLAAFREVLEEHQIPSDPDLVCCGHFMRGRAEVEVHSLLSRDAEFDAVIAANDAMALGALTALRKHGRRVPRDVMVAGFDDVNEVALVNPPMTTTRQPLKAMAELALRVVLRSAGRTPCRKCVPAADRACHQTIVRMRHSRAIGWSFEEATSRRSSHYVCRAE